MAKAEEQRKKQQKIGSPSRADKLKDTVTPLNNK